MFLQIWKLANEQTDTTFDKEQAKLQVLKYLFPRNSKLARRLLAQQTKPESSTQTGSFSKNENTSLSSKLASELVDTDPGTAAALLEQSLSTNPTPGGIGALSRLREKDSMLSDYIAAKMLDALKSQSTLVSLSALQLMTGYAFPGAEAPVFSVDAETSLKQLQLRYFVTAYDLLKTSLGETTEALMRDQHFTRRDIQYRAANQGQVAAILSALAPRMQPALSAELNDLAAKLAPQVPENIAQMTQFALRRLSGKETDDPEGRLAVALSKGEFGEAHKALDLVKDDQRKEAYTQLLIRNEARSLLKQSEIMKALTLIRTLSDQPARLIMYLDALKAAKKKPDADLTNIIINEARLLIPQVERNGLHARALFSFANTMAGATPNNDDALDFLNSAVTTINALATRPSEERPTSMAEAALAELNDPNSLLDAPEMEQAFTALGLIDLERALEHARRIEPRAVQFTARLEAIQGVIKRAPLRPRPASEPRKPNNVDRLSTKP
jgi:hypothetical protein